jgi:hypothetical protein
MSDGGCSGSCDGTKEMEELHKIYPELLVFVVGFGSGCDRNTLNNLANKAGGQFFFGVDGAQLKSEFQKVSVEISGGEMAI